jgi:hypothetical protein
MTRVNGSGSLFIRSRREARDANSMLGYSRLVNAEKAVVMASREIVRRNEPVLDIFQSRAYTRLWQDRSFGNGQKKEAKK